MSLLPFKLIVTPILIVATSLVARRWGPKLGGLLAGLPLTSAPVSVFLAIEQGLPFAAQAALGTLVGVASVGTFCLAYSMTARHRGWRLCTIAGIACFLLVTATFRMFSVGLVSGATLTASTLTAVLLALPRAVVAPPVQKPSVWDLPSRALVATSLVLLLTGAAPFIGAQLVGLLSPFPVFANVLAAFTHAHDGANASTLLLRGVILSSFGFAAFFLVVAWGLPVLGIAITYSLATLAAMLISLVTYQLDRLLA